MCSRICLLLIRDIPARGAKLFGPEDPLSREHRADIDQLATACFGSLLVFSLEAIGTYVVVQPVQPCHGLPYGYFGRENREEDAASRERKQEHHEYGEHNPVSIPGEKSKSNLYYII